MHLVSKLANEQKCDARFEHVEVSKKVASKAIKDLSIFKSVITVEKKSSSSNISE